MGGGVFVRAWLIALLLVLLATCSITYALEASPSKAFYRPAETLVISGRATPSGLVVALVYNPNGTLVALDQVRAGPDGSFTMAPLSFPAEPTQLLPYGVYRIAVRDVSTGEEVEIRVSFVRYVVLIKGVVLDHEGKPLPGALVELTTPSLERRIATTNATGAFTFYEGETGTYELVVSATGYEREKTRFEIGFAPAEVDVRVIMSRPELVLALALIEVEGKPFAGYVREGQELKVYAQVSYAGRILERATVEGNLECVGEGPAGFRLLYNDTLRLYVGSIRVPEVGRDRACTLTLTASYGGAFKSTEVNLTVFTGLGPVEEIRKMVEALEMRMNLLEEKIRGLAETQATVEALVSELRRELVDLKTAVGGLNLTGLDERIEALRRRLDNIEAGLGGYVSREELSSLSAHITDLSNQLQALREDIGKLKEREGPGAAGFVVLSAVAVAALIFSIATFIYVRSRIVT